MLVFSDVWLRKKQAAAKLQVLQTVLCGPSGNDRGPQLYLKRLRLKRWGCCALRFFMRAAVGDFHIPNTQRARSRYHFCGFNVFICIYSLPFVGANGIRVCVFEPVLLALAGGRRQGVALVHISVWVLHSGQQRPASRVEYYVVLRFRPF